MKSGSRLTTLQAAWVIARRDFTAILFSKAFLFFLIGPLFFLGISGGAGVLGANAARSAAEPTLALDLPDADRMAFREAHGELSEFTAMPQLASLNTDGAADAAQLLEDGEDNVDAVLAGSLAEPRLVGPQDRIEEWRGQVGLAIARARGDTGALTPPAIELAPTASSIASERSSRTGIATASLMLLFLLTMLLAGMVLSNLVEEKGNKIIEILAAAIPMDAVFLGKLVAMLGISLVGISVWGSVAGAILLLGGDAIPDITPPAIGWPLFAPLFLLYFAMAYLLIGSVFLAVGSLAPTVREVQTISMPATFLQLLVFFLATYAMTDQGSPVETFAVLFPLSSPFAMLARGAQDATLWIHPVMLAWQALWVIVFVKFGANLFRKRVMKSGPRGAKTRKGGLFARRRKDGSQIAT
ncbi:ABC transporter permease [Qipengyuania sp. JC766]|uniref:ABC transporter permease n=1 Tax=Qipengyuania sp. JC766 TaxID=3232139 RepID=UPI003459B7F5